MMDGDHGVDGQGPRHGGPAGFRHREEFADTVVVPGPNLRSRFVDTEEVDDDAAELIVDADAAGFCPTCHRVLPADAVACPGDGTSVVQLPPAAPPE